MEGTWIWLWGKWDRGDMNMVVGKVGWRGHEYGCEEKWDGGDINMVVGKVGWRGHEYGCGESGMEGT